VLRPSLEALVVIGAGPAGLAAACSTSTLNPLVIEAGPRQGARVQKDPALILHGVGGAGLFSDGKFSFWPSGTALWELEPELLREAYEWFGAQLVTCNIAAPPLTNNGRHDPPVEDRYEKRYPSCYATFDDRHKLIENLESSISRLMTDTRVVRVTRNGEVWMVETDRKGRVAARNVILATGRFGPILAWRVLPGNALRFRRLEVGARIEQDADQFFLAHHAQLDPKYVWLDDTEGLEWRTFCCCREGLVVWATFDNVGTVSGRADCPPTGRSNIGFNVRFKDPQKVARVWRQVRDTLQTLGEPVREELGVFLDRVRLAEPSQLAGTLGPLASASLAKGLRRLLEDFPGRGLEEAMLIGPAVEGVGWYPLHDGRLSTPVPGLWVAGDLVGSFRGLTAALVSGYVAGIAVVRDVAREVTGGR
jgi:uncharacterized protein